MPGSSGSATVLYGCADRRRGLAAGAGGPARGGRPLRDGSATAVLGVPAWVVTDRRLHLHELRGSAAVEERQLRGRGLAAFGYQPTLLARLLRLHHFLALARSTPPARSTLAALAAAAGYADQAHLSRDSRAWTGEQRPCFCLVAGGRSPTSAPHRRAFPGRSPASTRRCTSTWARTTASWSTCPHARRHLELGQAADGNLGDDGYSRMAKHQRGPGHPGSRRQRRWPDYSFEGRSMAAGAEPMRHHATLAQMLTLLREKDLNALADPTLGRHERERAGHRRRRWPLKAVHR